MDKRIISNIYRNRSVQLYEIEKFRLTIQIIWEEESYYYRPDNIKRIVSQKLKSQIFLNIKIFSQRNIFLRPRNI